MSCKTCRHWGTTEYAKAYLAYPGAPTMGGDHRQCTVIADATSSEPSLLPFIRSGDGNYNDGGLWTPPEFSCLLDLPPWKVVDPYGAEGSAGIGAATTSGGVG